MTATGAQRPLGALAIATGIGIAAFWATFFTVGLVPERAPACHLAFEHAFPLPDGVLALALVVAGVLLRRGHPLGRTLALVSAGALVFLGLLDASFNVQQGIYGLSAADLVVNAAINAWCVAFGLTLAVRLAR